VKEPSATEFVAGAGTDDDVPRTVRPDRPQVRTAALEAPVSERSLLARLRVPLMLAGVAVVLAFALYAYLTGGRYEATDDAYIRVAGVDVSANVAGRVVEIDVKENQRVRTGQVLFRLDPAPSDIAAEQAEAQLADAHQQLQAQLAAYRQQQVELNNAQTAAAYRERERKREQELLTAGAISQSEYDQAKNAADTARLQVATVQQQLAASLANLGGTLDVSAAAHPNVREAQAQLDRAKLQQTWTIVRASQDGRVTKVDQLQVGDYINAATPVFHLVADRVWVEAAFKENQLNHMCIGQPAAITVDAYPGHSFDALVQSVAPGTDQTFSLLPAENASGNWVKVVQRLPVRLTFAKALPIELQAGLSAKVKVDTGYKRGLFGGAHGTCR